MTLAANPTETLFRAHGQFNGLSPLDESIANAREYQRQIGCLSLEVRRLRDALAERDELIAALQERVERAELEAHELRCAELRFG